MYKLRGDNKFLAQNVAGAFLIKGLGMIVSVLMMPLYLKYFSNNVVLGVWFTLLTVLNWILTFDLGIGNGLRNKLTIALSEKDAKKIKTLISSSYFMLGGTVVVMCAGFLCISFFVNWNAFFNISPSLLNSEDLRFCVIFLISGIFVSFFLRLINSILYALQWSAANNFLSLITSVLLLAYLLVVSPLPSVSGNFKNLSIYYAVCINIPLLIATGVVFSTKLKGQFPSFRDFSLSCAKGVFSLGIVFFALQILYMVISVTNEWFISKFYAPQYCVDYQVYYKIFSLMGTLYSLALTPLWSAITKAYAEKRYRWILKLSRYLNLSVLLLVLLQLAIAPFFQTIINLWLGKNAIVVDSLRVLVFISYSIVFIWIAVQSTIVAGLGILKTQLYCYIFAAVFKVLAIVVVSKYTNDWITVVGITVVALLPYSIIQPFQLRKNLKKLEA